MEHALQLLEMNRKKYMNCQEKKVANVFSSDSSEHVKNL